MDRNAKNVAAGKERTSMRIFASASAAAVAVATSFAVIPAAMGAAKPSHPLPLTHVQPGGPIAVSHSQPAFRGPDVRGTTKVASSNWGGYASLRSASRFRYIQSTFFVPYADCKSTPNSFSGHWVGRDGLTDGTVEQDGILAACAGGAHSASPRSITAARYSISRRLSSMGPRSIPTGCGRADRGTPPARGRCGGLASSLLASPRAARCPP
jgi:hypothetical protein